MITKICKHCGKEFKIFPYLKDRAQYCSISCSKIGKNLGNTNGFKKGNVPPNKGIKNPGVGGRKSGGIPWNKGIPMSELAKIKLSNTQKGNKYSQDTQFKFGQIPWNLGINQISTSGENNHNWKGGITPQREKERKTIDMSLWKREVLKRDNFTCQKTGIIGGNLVVHHINNFSDFPELRSILENGVTLSLNSHKEFHKKYGYKNNTLEQLQEFLNDNII